MRIFKKYFVFFSILFVFSILSGGYGKAASQELALSDLYENEIFRFQDIPWDTPADELQDVVDIPIKEISSIFGLPCDEQNRAFAGETSYNFLGQESTVYFVCYATGLYQVELRIEGEGLNEVASEWKEKFVKEFGDMQKQVIYYPPNHRMTNSQWIHINEEEQMEYTFQFMVYNNIEEQVDQISVVVGYTPCALYADIQYE